MHKNQSALTPPMGWNSWDCYAASVNEEHLLGNAEYMAKHLKAFGWEYIVCDIQWSEPNAGSTSREYIPFAPLTLDEYGRQLPAPNRFPSARDSKGFKPIADKVHALGLKFGIHIMRGIPRQAVHARLPILGTTTTADQIADPASICRWNSDMYGVNPQQPGAQAYYDSIFSLYASWGVDYVKVDDICNTNIYPHAPYSAEKEIQMIAKAIESCGRPMVLSLSPGPAVIEKAWHLAKHANLWRITDDFWDRWELLANMFERCELWQRHVAAGCWPDCDMLPLGHIGMGFHRGRLTNFTQDEQLTMMTLWCIFRSPLMMGGEMRDNDDWTLSLLTNRAVLRLLGHSHSAQQLERDAEHAVWMSLDEDGSTYFALFNLASQTREVTADLTTCGFTPGRARELWKDVEVTLASDHISMAIPAHGAMLLRASR
ncbi:MAG: glycoside hydrolase family 27 protein [Eubacteriales bacterium]|nr:glycoside hydrolase family 27 protein [Eubacteriales bacterium]